MEVKELTMGKLNPKKFIEDKVREIASTVGSGLAINALSGGVDSSAVTMLGHQALGDRLKTYFIENGIMREGEAKQIVGEFQQHGTDETRRLQARRDVEGGCAEGRIGLL
jgi:GMP synthase (glutamine-hydrolysing)